MLSVTPVSAGTAGLDYLLRQTGCAAEHEDPERDREREAAHAGAEYLIDGHESGEPAGRWLGTGLAHLGLREAGVADADTVRQVFGRLEHPETGERLGRKTYDYKTPTERLEAALAAEPNATPERVAELTWQVTNSQQRAVGYFDLTFSPAKSVSLYYAGLLAEGRPEDAAKVWAAHREGVAAAFAHLQGEAGYSRAGYHGRTANGRSVGDYVEARHWVAARFDHTTNREHEPQLHSHVAVLNRVRCEGDGRWRTLDSRALHHAKRGADAVYELTMEQAVMRDLPVRFAIREDGRAREIAGITVEQRAAVSTRRAQVVTRVAAQVREYEDKHGHAPPPYELVLMHQQAALHSRAKKDGPQTPEQLQAQWAVHATMLRTAVASAEAAVRDKPGVPEVDHERLVRAAIHEVQQARASWTRSDLMLAIKQQLPGRVAAQDGPGVERFIAGLADDALRPGSRYGLVLLTAPDVVTPPKELLRASDARSRFRPHRDERYCTEGQLSAEERLVATARAGGAPVLTPEQLVVVEAELVRRGLGADQREAVLGILGSGRRGDVLIGPAGAGKSYTTGELKHQWEGHFGPVLGLATSQNAANVLREEGLDALNVAAFLASHEPDERTGLPHEQLPQGALLVIDETGMSATEQLDRVRKVAEAAGAKMLWTGDHAQLDSVGAGGALRLLAADVPVFELTEVRRFDNEWEREASLRLRAGDRAALAEYDHRGRVFEGTVEEMREAAYQGYLADSLMGKRSLLLVGSNEQAAELAGQVRAELTRLGQVEAGGALLRDGNLAGAGDLVQTRRNAWDLVSETGRAVANRDVWRVVERTSDGLRVQLDRDPSVAVTLPRPYVDQDVTLAYASTSHAAQGRTVDTGHAVVDVSMTRGELYPNLTRGREWNGAYVVTNAEADDERGNEPLRSDRVAVLSEVLDRDTAQHAAVQVMREEIEDAGSLATMGTIWAKVVSEQARHRYAEALRDALGPERTDRLATEHGAGRLYRAVRNAELSGHDPHEVLRAAVQRGDLSDADSLSDVLRYRLNSAVRDGRGEVASWLARTPAVDTEVGRYTRELALAMDRRQAALGEQAATDPPEWARQHLGAVPDEPEQRAAWVQRAGAVAGWRELINAQGPSVLGAAPSREMPEQRAAWHAAYTALGADEAGRDYAAASDDELTAMVTRHDREQEWAPAYVADQLGEAQRRAVVYQRKAVLLRAEAAATGTDQDRAMHEGRAMIQETAARSEAARAGQLEQIHEARQLWAEHTADHAHAADMSRRELARRTGEDVDRTPEEQHTVRDPSTTREDLEVAAARAREATERILAQREAEREASERASREPVRTEPDRGYEPER